MNSTVKLVTILQTIWLCLQIVSRLREKLPVSLLEFLTAEFVIIALVRLRVLTHELGFRCYSYNDRLHIIIKLNSAPANAKTRSPTSAGCPRHTVWKDLLKLTLAMSCSDYCATGNPLKISRHPKWDESDKSMRIEESKYIIQSSKCVKRG